MSELDKKLQEFVLNTYASSLLRDSVTSAAYKVQYGNTAISPQERDALMESVEGFVSSIKQAFIDDGWVKKNTQDSLIKQIVDMTGNEFAMGYDDSACYWHFHNGVRGNGRMLFGVDFYSESPEVDEALTEYRDFLVQEAAKKAAGTKR